MLDPFVSVSARDFGSRRQIWDGYQHTFKWLIAKSVFGSKLTSSGALATSGTDHFAAIGFRLSSASKSCGGGLIDMRRV